MSKNEKKKKISVKQNDHCSPEKTKQNKTKQTNNNNNNLEDVITKPR